MDSIRPGGGRPFEDKADAVTIAGVLLYLGGLGCVAVAAGLALRAGRTDLAVLCMVGSALFTAARSAR